jgi:hypothetical protein
MEALQEMDNTVEFDIFTSVPSWFFETSLTGRFHYHFLVTDIGFAQETALKADIGETLTRLNHFFPPETPVITLPATLLRERRCALAICDIAPLGILAARHAGIRSVLIENFTWDWLYEEYLPREAGFEKIIRYLREVFGLADLHIQTDPVCLPGEARRATRPVSRKPRLSPEEVKDRLKIPGGAKTVMITMGGIPESYPFLQQLRSFPQVYFLLPGVGDKPLIRGNLVCLPHRSDFFHPDLVNASDALIAKVGYSTVAEAYYAGVPFGYIGRDHFRESRVLISFVNESMTGVPIDKTDFYSGAFLSSLPRLLSMPRIERLEPNGADQAARLILDELSSR